MMRGNPRITNQALVFFPLPPLHSTNALASAMATVAGMDCCTSRKGTGQRQPSHYYSLE